MRAALPVLLGYLAIGFAFGVLARTAGLSVAEIGLMSLLVYAGSAQFIGVGMLSAGASASAIISTTLLVNLRHLLMSTALVPSLRRNSVGRNALLAYGITDETFAVNAALLQGRAADPRFVAGLHVTAQSSWVAASLAGALLGQMLQNTPALGLDFALPAMFVGLLVPQLNGPERRPRLAAALAAAGVSTGAALLSPGNNWGIIVATLTAATLGAVWRCARPASAG